MSEPKLLRRPLPPKIETELLIPRRKDHKDDEATSAIQPGDQDEEMSRDSEDIGIKLVYTKSHQILFALPHSVDSTPSILDYDSILKLSALPLDSIKRDFIIPQQLTGPPSFPLHKRRIPVRLKLPRLKFRQLVLPSDYTLKGHTAVVSPISRRSSAVHRKPTISRFNYEVRTTQLIHDLMKGEQEEVNTIMLPGADFPYATATKPERHLPSEKFLEKLDISREAETEEAAAREKISHLHDEFKKGKKKRVSYADQLEDDSASLSFVSGFGCDMDISPEEEERQLMGKAEMAILCCLMHKRSGLSLKAYFLPMVPDLSALTDFLVYLNLSFNDLRLFPTEVCDLKCLHILKLRNNPIKCIPEDIKKLTELKILVMSFNLLTELPPWLFTLQNLELLDVSYNEIEYISNAIANARSLSCLNIEGNLLYFLPSGILKLHLNRLKVENNFLHPFFWREVEQLQPQRLVDMACLCFIRNNLWERYPEIPEDIQKLLGRCGICDCCSGPLYGRGFCFIRAYKNIFGFRVPYMFSACSPACYVNVIT